MSCVSVKTFFSETFMVFPMSNVVMAVFQIIFLRKASCNLNDKVSSSGSPMELVAANFK